MADFLQTMFYNTVFLNENVSIKISLNIVPYGPIDNKSVLVQIMAWHRTGHESLSEPMMAYLSYEYMLTRTQ